MSEGGSLRCTTERRAGEELGIHQGGQGGEDELALQKGEEGMRYSSTPLMWRKADGKPPLVDEDLVRFQTEPAAALHFRTFVREDLGPLGLAEMFVGTVSRWHVVRMATPRDVLSKFSFFWVFHSETEGIRLGVLELPVMCRA